MAFVKVHNVNGAAQKQYLRTVSTPDTRKELSFLYIGEDSDTYERLSPSFLNGHHSEDFEAAKRILFSSSISYTIDAIFIDLPYEESKFRQFQTVLEKTRDFNDCAVFYLESDRKLDHSVLNGLGFIDDVIDIKKFPFNLCGKIAFLKKAKQYAETKPRKHIKLGSPTSFSKRCIDILFSLVALIILLPLFVLIAIAIRLESRGPIFYNARRAGRGFKIFKFYKFRTMEVNADKKIEHLKHLNQYDANPKGPRFFKINNDPRITRVGKFLRNTSLDELPQLLNVLKGDMSLVGNRPLPLYEASTLTTNDYVERFMAPAGITGLWQIKKRGNSDMSVEERISLDISYARKNNFLYDLWIIANTPGALFQKSNV